MSSRPSISVSTAQPQSSSIAALACITPISTTSTLAHNPVASDDLHALATLIQTMRISMDSVATVLDTVVKQTASIVEIAPAVEAKQQITALREEVKNQWVRQERNIEELKVLVRECITKELTDRLRAKMYESVQSKIAETVNERVEKQLDQRIPDALRHQVKQYKRQILEIRTNLENSEARRYNALLRSPVETLRPLLRPFPIQSPSPAPSTLFATSMPPPATPAVPEPPAPTPVRDSFAEPRLEPPTPSPLFPRDLAELFKLNEDAARVLVREYGLVDEDTIPTPVSAFASPGADSRDENLNKFLAHIGVPYKMVLGMPLINDP